MEASERFLENWAKLSNELNNEPAWLKRQRAESRSHFESIGFPTTKNEEWKYTNLQSLTQTTFELADPKIDKINELKELIDKYLLPGAISMVFIEGSFNADLSDFSEKPDGLIIEALSNAVGNDSYRLEEKLGALLPKPIEHFEALNSAMWRDGAYICVKENRTIKPAIQLIHIGSTTIQASEATLRHLFEVEKNSSLQIVESYISLNNRPGFTNVLSEYFVADNASVDRYKVEDENNSSFHISRTYLRENRDSRVRSHVFSFKGQLVRNDLNSDMQAEGADCLFSGLYLVDQERVVDHHTVINHAKPHCTSTELYKGILNDKAKATFNGKVYVRHGAQGTQAEQSNKNMLLSQAATINTKPQLEIWADDVKCSHGATVGQLDADAMYYLRTRGIGKIEARNMLLRAFAAELLDGIKCLPLRIQLEDLLEEAL